MFISTALLRKARAAEIIYQQRNKAEPTQMVPPMIRVFHPKKVGAWALISGVMRDVQTARALLGMPGKPPRIVYVSLDTLQRTGFKCDALYVQGNHTLTHLEYVARVSWFSAQRKCGTRIELAA